MGTSLLFHRRSRVHPALYSPPPLLLVLPSSVQKIRSSRPTTPYSNATGYYFKEQRAGTADHVASDISPICREEPQWGLGWRQLSSGCWLRRILASIESFSNLCGIVSFQNVAPTSSRQTGKVFSDHDTWPQPEPQPASDQNLHTLDGDLAPSVSFDVYWNHDPWRNEISLQWDNTNYTTNADYTPSYSDHRLWDTKDSFGTNNSGYFQL